MFLKIRTNSGSLASAGSARPLGDPPSHPRCPQEFCISPEGLVAGLHLLVPSLLGHSLGEARLLFMGKHSGMLMDYINEEGAVSGSEEVIMFWPSV